MYIVPCLLPTREAESGMAPRPEAFRLLGLTGLVSLPGSSPEGLAPRGGGMGEDEEDAEGVVEPPEASAPEVPMEPPEPRSPEQVGPPGRPGKPRRGQCARVGQATPGLPALWSLCARAAGLSPSWPWPHTPPFPAAAFTAPCLGRAAAASRGWTGVQGSEAVLLRVPPRMVLVSRADS